MKQAKEYCSTSKHLPLEIYTVAPPHKAVVQVILAVTLVKRKYGVLGCWITLPRVNPIEHTRKHHLNRFILPQATLNTYKYSFYPRTIKANS